MNPYLEGCHLQLIGVELIRQTKYFFGYSHFLISFENETDS